MGNKYKLTTEQDVLDALGAKDFRSISKQQLMSFTSQLHMMDPEVAKAAIAQFPEFKDASLQIVTQLHDLCEKAIVTDNNAAIEAYQKILDNLETELHKPFLSKKRKDEIVEQMIAVSQNIEGIEDKKLAHKKGVIGIFAGAGAAIAAILAAAIGVNVHKE